MTTRIKLAAEVRGSFYDTPGLQSSPIASTGNKDFNPSSIKGFRLLPDLNSSRYPSGSGMTQVYCRVVIYDGLPALFVFRFRKDWPITRYDQMESWLILPEGKISWVDAQNTLPEIQKYSSRETSGLPHILEAEESPGKIYSEEFLIRLIHSSLNHEAMCVNGIDGTAIQLEEQIRALPRGFQKTCSFGFSLSEDDDYARKYLDVYTCITGTGTENYSVSLTREDIARIKRMISENLTDETESVEKIAIKMAWEYEEKPLFSYLQLIRLSIAVTDTPEFTFSHEEVVRMKLYLDLFIQEENIDKEGLRLFIRFYRHLFSLPDFDHELFRRIWESPHAKEILQLLENDPLHTDILKVWINFLIINDKKQSDPSIPLALEEHPSVYASSPMLLKDDTVVLSLAGKDKISVDPLKHIRSYEKYREAYNSILPPESVFYKRIETSNLKSQLPQGSERLDFILKYSEDLTHPFNDLFDDWLDDYSCDEIIRLAQSDHKYLKVIKHFGSILVRKSQKLKITRVTDLLTKIRFLAVLDIRKNLTGSIIRFLPEIMLLSDGHKTISEYKAFYSADLVFASGLSLIGNRRWKKMEARQRTQLLEILECLDLSERKKRSLRKLGEKRKFAIVQILHEFKNKRLLTLFQMIPEEEIAHLRKRGRLLMILLFIISFLLLSLILFNVCLYYPVW